MTHTYNAARKRRYRYYTCIRILKLGRAACPSRSLPASEIEKAVVDQVRCIANDPKLRSAVFDETQAYLRQHLEECRANHAASVRELNWLEEELKQTTQSGQTDAATTTLAAELQDRLTLEHSKFAKLCNQLMEMEAAEVKVEDIARTMGNFDNLWSTLSPREQWHLLGMLIKRVEFDATESSFEIFSRTPASGHCRERRIVRQVDASQTCHSLLQRSAAVSPHWDWTKARPSATT